MHTLSRGIDTVPKEWPSRGLARYGAIMHMIFVQGLIIQGLAGQVLELMEGGDLRNALSGPFREEMRWYRNGQHLALDIVRGIYFLHQNRVLHGDLKVGCYLISPAGNQIAMGGLRSYVEGSLSGGEFP